MEISQFDNFFTELEKKVKASPEYASKTIRRAIMETNCPYMKKHLKALQKMYGAG